MNQNKKYIHLQNYYDYLHNEIWDFLWFEYVKQHSSNLLQFGRSFIINMVLSVLDKQQYSEMTKNPEKISEYLSERIKKIKPAGQVWKHGQDM